MDYYYKIEFGDLKSEHVKSCKAFMDYLYGDSNEEDANNGFNDIYDLSIYSEYSDETKDEWYKTYGKSHFIPEPYVTYTAKGKDSGHPEYLKYVFELFRQKIYPYATFHISSFSPQAGFYFQDSLLWGERKTSSLNKSEIKEALQEIDCSSIPKTMSELSGYANCIKCTDILAEAKKQIYTYYYRITLVGAEDLSLSHHQTCEHFFDYLFTPAITPKKPSLFQKLLLRFRPADIATSYEFPQLFDFECCGTDEEKAKALGVKPRKTLAYSALSYADNINVYITNLLDILSRKLPVKLDNIIVEAMSLEKKSYHVLMRDNSSSWKQCNIARDAFTGTVKSFSKDAQNPGNKELWTTLFEVAKVDNQWIDLQR